MFVEGALVAKPEVEIWRRPDFWTFRPNFLFDPQYIIGSISHRYGATPGAVTINAIVKASGNAKIFDVENAFFQL